MSLVATRIALRNRVTVQRLTSTPDGGGGVTEEWADHAADVPCRAWTDVRRDAEAEQGGKVTVVNDRRVIVPLGVDVTEADRLGDVTENAAVVFGGPMRIEAVARHRTHIELLVSEVS